MTPQQIRARASFAIRALDAIEASESQDGAPRDEAKRRERVAHAVRIFCTVLATSETADATGAPKN
jgi:hypothetical protein